jgi:hypothetical protein
MAAVRLAFIGDIYLSERQLPLIPTAIPPSYLHFSDDWALRKQETIYGQTNQTFEPQTDSRSQGLTRSRYRSVKNGGKCMLIAADLKEIRAKRVGASQHCRLQ